MMNGILFVFGAILGLCLLPIVGSVLLLPLGLLISLDDAISQNVNLEACAYVFAGLILPFVQLILFLWVKPFVEFAKKHNIYNISIQTYLFHIVLWIAMGSILTRDIYWVLNIALAFSLSYAIYRFQIWKR